MNTATILKVLLIVGIIAFGVLIFWIWWGFYKTKSTDISAQTKYAELVGEEVVAKNESFIAKNYKPDVKINSYQLKMGSRFNDRVGEVYTLPIGTKFKIGSAKTIHDAVSGFDTNYVLGSVFIKELGKDVEFEFAWGATIAASWCDEEPYDLFQKAPWFSDALPYKFYHDGQKKSYNHDFNNALILFPSRPTFQPNRNFDKIYAEGTTKSSERDYFKVGKKLSNEHEALFKLNQIYPDNAANPDSYAFHADYELQLSCNFTSLVLTVFKGEHEMESQLINYDQDANIIDSFIISYDEIAESMLKKECTLEENTITVNNIVSLDKETVTTTTYRIQEDGHFKLISDTIESSPN